MSGEGPRLLRPAEAGRPVDRLWLALPAGWRGPIVGPGIEDWEKFSESGERRLDLTGLPEQIARELAWMAHWQAMDGTRSSVLGMNQLANILRRAAAERHPFPGSVLDMDWDAASALQGWFYATRWGRLPPKDARSRLRVVFRFARLALTARCAGGPWWALDEWHPRCDPRIPLTGREPQANYGCSPGRISQPWLREAAKWHLGAMLESGALRWTTVSQERMPSLARFSRHLDACFADARDVLGDASAASAQAAAFARWTPIPPTGPTAAARRRKPSGRGWSTTTSARSPTCSRSQRPARPRPGACWARRRGTASPRRTRRAGTGRWPGSRTGPSAPTPTTSMTAPWPRSSPRCRCSACRAASR